MHVYIWARSGAYPGGMYVVPVAYLHRAIHRLALIRAAEPGFTWHTYATLHDADAQVRRAARTAGGEWAGGSQLLICAKPDHCTCLVAMVDASHWLWAPFPGGG